MNELTIVWGLMVSLLQLNAKIPKPPEPIVIYRPPMPHTKVTCDSLWADELAADSVVGNYIYWPYGRYNPCKKYQSIITELD